WDLGDPLFKNLGFLLGILTIIYWVRLLIKCIQKPNLHSSFFLLSLMPLLPVTIRMTGQSGYDSYLILGCFFLPIFLGSETKKIAKWAHLSSLGSKITFSFFLIYCFLTTALQVSGWSDSTIMAERMVEIRRSPFHLSVLAKDRMAKRSDYVFALELGLEAYAKDPREVNLGYVLGESIRRHPNLSQGEKMGLFRSLSLESPSWYLAKSVYGHSIQDNELLFLGLRQLSLLPVSKLSMEFNIDQIDRLKNLCVKVQTPTEICRQDKLQTF
ncbi:MAG: hypothetical protein WCH11_00955, partial [Bdellovibrio sp.]